MGLALATPALADDCITSQQSSPIGPAPPATTFRANMVRLDAPVGPPVAKPVRARPHGKAGIHRAHARRPVAKRSARARPKRPSRPAVLAAAPVAAPLIPGGMSPYRAPAPEPPTLLRSMLVTRTICNTGPALASPIEVADRLAAPNGVLFPGEGGQVFDGGIVVGNPPFVPPGGDGPGFVPPPLTPPGPPTETGPVPEPGTWALMILGFGAVGASLRRRRAHRA